MENHTFISATFEYEEKLVEKHVDFWEKMYDDPIRLLLIGPMEIIFFMIYVPAFIGIFDYIRNRSVKYRKPNIFLLCNSCLLILKITGLFWLMLKEECIAIYFSIFWLDIRFPLSRATMVHIRQFYVGGWNGSTISCQLDYSFHFVSTS